MKTATLGAALLGAMVLLVGCDGKGGSALLCQNPATGALETCCLNPDGSYTLCKALPGGGGDAAGAGDALAGADAGGTGGAGDALEPGDTGGGGGDAGGDPDVGGTGSADAGGTSGPDTGGADTAGPDDTAGGDDAGGGPDAGGDDAGGCQDCEPGTAKCADEAHRSVCIETEDGCSEWQVEPCAEETVCTTGACVTPSCAVDAPCDAPGAADCLAQTARECMETDTPGCSEWVVIDTCTGAETCKQGECVAPECPTATKCTTKGATKCDAAGGAVLECQASAADPACLQWTKKVTCGLDEACNGGHCVVVAGLDCNGYINCTSECADAEACLAACEEDTTTAGFTQAQALIDCAQTSCPNPASTAGFQACFYEKCKSQVLGCGGYFHGGPGGCADLVDCQGGCGDTDKECLVDCWSTVDYQAHINALKMIACPDEKCWLYTPGTFDFQTCVQTQCASVINTCNADTN